MTESIIEYLQGLPPLGVYAALFFTAYIENIFPPAPSDVVMLFIATLVGMGTIGIVPAIGVATAGSVLGFMTAFWIGRRFGRRLIESNRVPFLNESALAKVDGWFDRWGYGVVVANRFLAGTRAVISFFTGMSQLDFVRTTLLCLVSALAWNSMIIWLGSLLGANWREGIVYLQRYGQVILVVLGLLVIVWLVRWYRRRGKVADAVERATGSHKAGSHGDDSHGDGSHGDGSRGDGSHGDRSHGDGSHGDRSHGDDSASA